MLATKDASFHHCIGISETVKKVKASAYSSRTRVVTTASPFTFRTKLELHQNFISLSF